MTMTQRVLAELKEGPASSFDISVELDMPINKACAFLCILEKNGLARKMQTLLPREPGKPGRAFRIWEAV